MATTLQSVGLTALGGLLWSGYSDEAKASPLVLRPPGALPEEDFLKACIKCGLCSEACVNRESNKNKDGSQRPGTLKMAKGGDHKLIGTPFFTPRDVPCYMCDDVCLSVRPERSMKRP